MAAIEWKEEYAIGIDSVDEQHQHLVEIINKFEEALAQGKGSRQMAEILSDLAGYTQEHFASEEKLMADADYDQLKLHQSQHRQLLQKIERFEFDFGTAGKRITAEVHEFLSYWLLAHILKEDMAFGASMAEPRADAQKVES